MKAPTNTSLLIALLGISISANAAPVAPSDVSGLDIWLTDAGNQFDGTTWLDASGNSNDATAVGSRLAGGTGFPAVTYLAGTASTQFGTAGVAFSGSADDLMTAGSFAGESAVTIITAYSTDTAASDTRPVGLGSQAAKGAGTSGLFNLATDGSLRYDNGNDGGNNNPTGQLLVRASRLDGGTVTDWLDDGTGLSTNIGPTSGSAPNPLGADADALYLGDVRAGATAVGGGGTTVSTADLFISQVAVFKGALTDTEVADVSSWMATNPSAIPEPASSAFLFGGLALLALLRRRR